MESSRDVRIAGSSAAHLDIREVRPLDFVFNLHAYSLQAEPRVVNNFRSVLYRDYSIDEVPVVIREMCDDLTLRLRLQGQLSSLVHLSIGYSASLGGFSHQMSLIRATDDEDTLYEALMRIYHRYVEAKPIRNITFAFRKLNPLDHEQLDLFTDAETTDKKRRLQLTIAHIKQRYGHNAILRTSALLKASTTRERHTLIGGHRK